MTAGPDAPGAFFGRRKGKQLRPGQSERVQRLVPRLRLPEPELLPADLASLFPASVREVWLEIGFGGGEHLRSQAAAKPDVGFIGIEPFVNGMATFLAGLEADGLANVRIWDGDASLLLPELPAASLGRVSLLFPDPWPKRRQRKRRFLSDENLTRLARVMRPGAELRFATDIDDYTGWALARVMRSGSFVWRPARPADWREPWPGWPGTRYEAKARKAGRSCAYLTFKRV